MNPRFRQYLFGAIFIGIGVYYAVGDDYLEASLYVLAGLSFILNTFANEPSVAEYRKPLVIVTWIFIIATAILFLWVMQFKYF